MDDKEKYSLKNILDNANKNLDTAIKELKNSSKNDIDLLKNTFYKNNLDKEDLTLEKEEGQDKITLEKQEEKPDLTLEKEEKAKTLKELEQNITQKTDAITETGDEVLEKLLDSAKKIEDKVNQILNIFS